MLGNRSDGNILMRRDCILRGVERSKWPRHHRRRKVEMTIRKGGDPSHSLVDISGRIGTGNQKQNIEMIVMSWS